MFKSQTNKVKQREVIVHIGLHKTGTTSIQNMLFLPQNIKTLEGFKKYVVKGVGDMKEHHWIASLFSDTPKMTYVNVYNQRTDAEIAIYNNSCLQGLNLYKNIDGDLILSSESIIALSEAGLKNIKNYFDAEFPQFCKRYVCFVREPLSLNMSAYQEIIKGGGNHLKNKISYDEQEKINKALSIFGEDLEIYSFEEAIKGKNSIYGFFLKNILYLNNQDINSIEIEKKTSNNSMTQLSVDLMAYINKLEPRFISGALNKNRTTNDMICLRFTSGSKFQYTQKEAKELIEKDTTICQFIKFVKEYNINYPTIEESISKLPKQIDKTLTVGEQNELLRAYKRATPFIKWGIKNFALERQEILGYKCFLNHIEKIINNFSHSDLAPRIVTEEELELIVNSELFDVYYYLKEYPDIANAQVDPLKHYCEYGWKEGRNPSANFITKDYIRENPDIERVGVNPLYHYLKHIKQKGKTLK